ncbi:MAG: Mur ligase family protein [Flavobacteriales bacterium]|jgi:dihydrofolate synthase/folylpolyglutamate synthase|nr:Mur ligase family protein [Flavobacteriales bacterium]
MNYQACCDWMFNRFSSFQQEGKTAFKPGLEKIRSLLAPILPEIEKIPIIHLAGTNGKGSTSSMIASALAYSGYQTGLFTSPHFLSFTERIQINGNYIPEKEITDLININKEFLEKHEASFFEITLWLAMHYFVKQKIEVLVLETGLGGRLDATNFHSKSLLSIITNIGLDHTDILGNTLEKIAIEKAGIIKKNGKILKGEKQLGEVDQKIREIASQQNSDLRWASDFVTQETEFYSGEEDFQKRNTQTAFAALKWIQEDLTMLTNQSITKGLQESQNIFFLPGRWQKLETKPISIFDMGHNENGVKAALKKLSNEKYEQLHLVWGNVSDKDSGIIFSLLPKEAHYYLTEISTNRSESLKNLEKFALAEKLRFSSYTNPRKAYINALENAQENDVVLVLGSAYLIAEIFSKNFSKSLAEIKKLTIFASSLKKAGD